MRSRQHVGRAGTAVIPPRWADAPRTIVAKTLTACVSLRHAGSTPGDFDPDTGSYPDAIGKASYWSGRGSVSIEPQFATRLEDAAEEPVTTVGYIVELPLSATDPADEIRIGDLVHVDELDSNGDPFLVGRDLTVTTVARGSLAWERVLGCVDQNPPAPEGVT